MGRSVDYLTNANKVVYFDVSDMGQYAPEIEGEGNERESFFDEFQNQMDWEDFKENIISALQSNFKSLFEVERRFDGNETRIILENYLTEIGLSEYCGCASLSIRVTENYDNREGLSEKWIEQVWENMLKTLKDSAGYPMIQIIGGFSNGESVYQKSEN